MSKFSEAATEDTQTTLATRNHDRDEDQQGIDALVKSRVDAWTAADKPTPDKLTQAMTVRLQTPAADKSELKRMLRRAYLLYKSEPAWYKDTEPDAQGNIIVKSGPQAVKVKAPKEAANGDQPQADQPPAVQTQADQGGEQPQADQRGRFSRR
jgi:hypothetical protein